MSAHVNASLPRHFSVVCSDDVVRRFYVDEGRSMLSPEVIGYILYDGLRIHGHSRKQSHTQQQVFVAHDGGLPMSGGWNRSPNCSAKRYCDQCRRCVGGCKS